jgi:hypothetical protein
VRASRTASPLLDFPRTAGGCLWLRRNGWLRPPPLEQASIDTGARADPPLRVAVALRVAALLSRFVKLHQAFLIVSWKVVGSIPVDVIAAFNGPQSLQQRCCPLLV